MEKEKPVILQTIASANQAATNLQNALKHVNKEDPSFLKLPAVSKNHVECKQLRKKVLHYIAGIQSEEWVGTLLETNDNLVAALQLYENYKSVAEVPDSDEESQAQIQREYHDEIYGTNSGAASPGVPRRRRTVDEDGHAKPPPKPARPGGGAPTPPAISRANKPGNISLSPAQSSRRNTRPEPETESEASEDEEEEEEVLSEGDENDPFANRNEDLALKTPAVEKAQPKW